MSFLTRRSFARGAAAVCAPLLVANPTIAQTAPSASEAAAYAGLHRAAAFGDAAQIRMAAFDYNVPLGTFAKMPNLGCIVYLGHGANDFLQRPDLPKGVPVMRLTDPGIIGCMTEHVLLYPLQIALR